MSTPKWPTPEVFQLCSPRSCCSQPLLSASRLVLGWSCLQQQFRINALHHLVSNLVKYSTRCGQVWPERVRCLDGNIVVAIQQEQLHSQDFQRDSVYFGANHAPMSMSNIQVVPPKSPPASSFLKSDKNYPSTKTSEPALPLTSPRVMWVTLSLRAIRPITEMSSIKHRVLHITPFCIALTILKLPTELTLKAWSLPAATLLWASSFVKTELSILTVETEQQALYAHTSMPCWRGPSDPWPVEMSECLSKHPNSRLFWGNLNQDVWFNTAVVT